MTSASEAKPKGFFSPGRAPSTDSASSFCRPAFLRLLFRLRYRLGDRPDAHRGPRRRGTVGSFFTAYSIAAVLVVLIGGDLIDKLGTRKASLLFSVLVFVGAAIVWQARSIPVFILGRFIFGAGSEPLIVAQSAILARWFKNKELALSFGITLTVCRIGSLFAFNTGELFTSYFGAIGPPSWSPCRLRDLARGKLGLYRHGPPGGADSGIAGRKRRRQDRPERHPGIQAHVLVRDVSLPDVLRGDLPLHQPVHGLFLRQMENREGRRNRREDSFTRSSTIFFTSSARRAAFRRSSSSPP